MNEILALFATPFAVSIAWFCTVLSFLFGFFQMREKKELRIKCECFEKNIYELNQQLISIQKNKQHIEQNGATNLNAAVVNGDFNFHQ